MFTTNVGYVRQAVADRLWRAVAVAALLASASPLAAQETGQVAGVVTSGQTGEPLAGVQVTAVGTQVGGLSNNEGRFLLLNVPAGEQTVLAQMIGYGEARQTVTVAAGGSAAVEFQLFTRAVALEGVVVTGTPIAAERREVANSISLITSDEIRVAGAMNFEDLLRGRAMGVSVTGSPGSAGAGSGLILRGVNSVNGRNQPLVYVDGVRMSTGTLEAAAGEAMEHASFLGSINPEDVARIEVIKGAAASTLYGTEASAGVIQIFTKKGQPGAPRWTFSAEQGISTIGHVGPEMDPTGLHVNDCTRQFVYDPERDEFDILEERDPGCPESGSWLRNGHVQDYQLSARGGGEDVTYYMSGHWGQEQGVVAPQHADDLNLRGNFTFTGFENFRVSLNNMYTRREIRWIPNGDNDEGLLYNVARGEDGETPDNDDSVVLDMELDQVINHFITSANIDWTPADNFRHRLTLGLDYSNSHYITERPWQFWDEPEGNRAVDIENRRVLTFDYAGSWRAALPADFSSTLSFGAQYNQDEHLGLRGDAEEFVFPGDKLLQSARTVANLTEDRDVTESGGFFIQEQLGWKNRLFVTGGLRADTHSSFGEDYTLDNQFTLYPKLQATYTLSDHDFWPSWWETFRLRGAYGESGEAPPADGSVTLWQVAGADENELGFIILNIANPHLGPERAREFEAGLDGSLLDGRVGFSTTWYRQTTYDGLINVAPPPSDGISETIPQNVGKWRSEGWEVGLDLLLYQGSSSRFSVNANYQFNDTRMIELGDPQFDAFTFNYLNSYREGYPMPALYGFELLNPDAVGELPEYTEDDTVFYAPSRPPHEIFLGASLTVFDRITLNVFGVGQYGHMLYDDLAQEMAQDGLWPPCIPINEKVDAGNLEGLTAREIARCSEDHGADLNEMWFEDADYFRLQSTSLSYQIPDSWLPETFTGATVQLRGTNLFTITDFSGLYPDALLRPAQQTARGAGYILPPAKTYTLNVRLNF